MPEAIGYRVQSPSNLGSVSWVGAPKATKFLLDGVKLGYNGAIQAFIYELVSPDSVHAS